MSYCLSPACQKPQNYELAKFCQSCGLKLLLGDRYRTLKPIGSGGFGRTFLAIDECIPSKPCCVIKQFFFQNQGVEQTDKAAALFRQEAVRLDELGQHPQIPELLAFYEQEHQQYLVQTYVDGQNLAQELAKNGAFNEAKIRELLHNLLPVLQFVHEHQVIHRDVKPENIIRQSGDGQLILVDFGAAKFATGTALQKTGTVIGSAGYAAPEQAAGKAVFASDLYSLGVTCIHLLTNVPPFDLYSFNEGDWVWRDYLSSPVSDVLSQVLDKMLQPATLRRFQSARAVLSALDSQPILLSADTPSFTAPAELIAKLSPTSQQTLPPITTPRSLSWQCVRSLTQHSGSVCSLVMSPNGRIFASGSFDRTIKLWTRAGDLVGSLKGHVAPVLSVAFSANGQVLISGSVDDTIKLWNITNGKLLHTLVDHSGSVVSISIVISPDGQMLASGSDDSTIKVWHLSTGKLLRTFGHDRAITSIVMSPDGQILASGSNDNTVRLWNFHTGELLRTLSSHPQDVNAIALSLDGQTLASGSSDHTIKIWEISTGALHQTLYGHSDLVRTVAVSPDGQFIASGSSDRTIKIWDFQTGKLLDTLSGHTKDVNTVTISSNSKTIISGSSDHTIKIWRLR